MIHVITEHWRAAQQALHAHPRGLYSAHRALTTTPGLFTPVDALMVALSTGQAELQRFQCQQAIRGFRAANDADGRGEAA